MSSKKTVDRPAMGKGRLVPSSSSNTGLIESDKEIRGVPFR